jgi:hypothetical protein
MIAKIATGEIENAAAKPKDEGKNPATVVLGRMGGRARAAARGKRKVKDIARKAAVVRWQSR